MVLYKILFLLIIYLGFASAQEYPDKYVNNLLKSGIDNIINQNFSNAKSDFNKLNSKYPQIPFGKIYLAAVEIAKAYDMGEEYEAAKIQKLLSEAENQSEQLIKKDPDNIWNQYFLGLTKGYISYYENLNGSWFTSIKEAIISASCLENCIKKDPDFFEAYSGLGSYKYWKSKKTEFLSWLPFINDEKDEGVNLLENAVDKSFYNTYLAVNSLIWIDIDQKKYLSAIKVAEKALNIYPNSRFFKWGIARAYEDIDPKKAIHYYNQILNSYSNLNSMNKCNEIILKHLIAQQYYKIGEKENALSLCNEILEIKKLNNFVLEKLADRLKKVLELKKKIKG